MGGRIDSGQRVGSTRQAGRLGNVDVFGDDWLDAEENNKLADMLFAWLMDEAELDMTCAKTPTSH